MRVSLIVPWMSSHARPSRHTLVECFLRTCRTISIPEVLDVGAVLPGGRALRDGEYKVRQATGGLAYRKKTSQTRAITTTVPRLIYIGFLLSLSLTLVRRSRC